MSGFAFLSAKWGNLIHGSPGGQVTWSLAATVGVFHSFEGQMVGVYQTLVRAAFDRWESLANVDLVESSDSSAVNIRIGWDSMDGPGGTLGEARYTHRSGSMTKAEIAFDIAEVWSIEAQSTAGSKSFFAVALHEIGHALGLAHTDDPQTLMYPYFGQQDLDNLDAEGIAVLYGRSVRSFGSNVSDKFTGSIGAEIFSAGEGADILYGAGGDDLLYGNEGEDVVFGNDGLDLIYGGQGGDVVYGGQSNDAVFGNMAEDQLFGNQGDDYVHGGQGNDFLHGGQGRDTLAGGVGNDTINGGLGGDRYVFAPGGGDDRIEGFSYGEGDRLDLGGQSYRTAALGGNLILTLGDGGTIALMGVDQSSSLI